MQGAPVAAAYRAIGCVVGPGHSVYTVLELKFGDPEVTLGTALDYDSCYFPNLVQVDLDPAWSGYRLCLDCWFMHK